MTKALPQVVDTISFMEEEPDVYFGTEAEPVGGYKQLLEFLEQKVSAGDTIGKKTAIPLYAIRFHINNKGGVDSAYVSIHHAACPIHRIIAEELVKTKRIPAKECGKAAPYTSNLSGKIHLTKSVQKSFDAGGLVVRNQNEPLNCVGLILQKSSYAPLAIKSLGSAFRLNTRYKKMLELCRLKKSYSRAEK